MHVSRSGFTAIELITVLAIITTLASMTVPAAMRAMDKGAVNRSAEGLRSVIMQAQDMARRQAAPTAGTSPASYGVAVVQSGGRAYATILYGTTLSDELMVDGQPVQRVDLGPGVHIRTSVSTEPSQPLNGSVGWFLAPTNGLPVENAGDAMVIDVGTEPQAARGRDFRSGSGSSWQIFQAALPAIPASPICSRLIIASNDGTHALGLQQYRVGLVRIYEP